MNALYVALHKSIWSMHNVNVKCKNVNTECISSFAKVNIKDVVLPYYALLCL